MAADLSLTDPHTIPTRHWHVLDDGRIQCDVCPRACKLREDQRGVCWVAGLRDEVNRRAEEDGDRRFVGHGTVSACMADAAKAPRASRASALRRA